MKLRSFYSAILANFPHIFILNVREEYGKIEKLSEMCLEGKIINCRPAEIGCPRTSTGEGNGTPLQYSCLEKSLGWRSLVGCCLWGCTELDTTERLHFHFSLSCIGEGDGNPLQCSCLENPRDGGAWWAAVYGVTPSRTRLKQLSSSSSSRTSTAMFALRNITRNLGSAKH